MNKFNSNVVKKIFVISVSLIIIFSIVTPIIFNILPHIILLYKSGNKRALYEYLHSFGSKGILIIIILQVFQVLSFIIPAPTIWITAGLTYEPIEALFCCIIGIIIGNSIAFYLGRKFSNRLINALVSKDTLNKFSYIENSKHAVIIEFLLYLIPIIPNSIIPYIYARTSISYSKFISIIAVACIPSILFNAYFGHIAISGHMTATVIIILLSIITAVLLLFKHDRIMSWIKKISSNT
ncbi:MAG: VTT domain-containing protein [Bacillota bacterium]|nr:VTT domain-containing protein [Bacillota bacterium]